MKKVISLFLVLIFSFTLVACDKDSHTGEAKTPSGSSILSGRNYVEVVEVFEEKGFTNIKTEPIYDLIIGLFTKDGEVEEVLVGGDVDYSADKWISADTEIVIRYHTYPVESEEIDATTDINEKEDEENLFEEDSYEKDEEATEPTKENLTIDNCADLSTLLALKNPEDDFVKNFSNKYIGSVIEFDGNIAYMSNHNDYKTRYDILIYGGNYSETSAFGPNFQFVDVNISDLNLVGENIPDSIGIGNNLHIIAEVGEYNELTGLFELYPISIQVR